MDTTGPRQSATWLVVRRHPLPSEEIVCGGVSFPSWSTYPSGFAPENLTTLPHRSVSSARNLLKSLGEPAITAPPRPANRVIIRGAERPALISLLSVSMISSGVFVGTPNPYHELAS